MKKVTNSKSISSLAFPDIREISKQLSQDVASHCLLGFKSVMDTANIPFFLAFGTCLGAYREQKFIDHDCDLDAGVFDTDSDRFIELVDSAKFAEKGLLVVRQDGQLLSFEFEQKVYLDVYFFNLDKDLYHCGAYKITTSQIGKGFNTIDFIGTTFNCPRETEQYLVDRYGTDWRTPIPNKHATR